MVQCSTMCITTSMKKKQHLSITPTEPENHHPKTNPNLNEEKSHVYQMEKSGDAACRSSHPYSYSKWLTQSQLPVSSNRAWYIAISSETLPT